MSASDKPRLAGRQPSNRGGVPRVRTGATPTGARKHGTLKVAPSATYAVRRGLSGAPTPRRLRSDPELVLRDPQIHAGQEPDRTTGARALPIYQTTSYVFKDTEHAANLFALKEFGNIYTRIMNPTQDAVEQRIASLEGGVGALLVAVGPGRRDPRDPQRRRGRRPHRRLRRRSTAAPCNLLKHTLPKFGIEVTFVDDPADPESWRAAVRPNTKLFFGETISNPKIEILDIEAVAGRGPRGGRAPHRRQHRRDALRAAAARAGRRHRRALGDEVPRRPRHDHRRRHRRRRHLRLRQGPREVPELQHARGELPRARVRAGPRRRRALGANLAYILKARVQLLRDLGSAIAPFNAFLIAQGIETLSLRIDRHLENTSAVAEFLEGHQQVESVRWASLAGDRARSSPTSTRPRAPVRCSRSRSPVALEAGRASWRACRLHCHVANIGDVRSLAIHPASTTHCQGATRTGSPPG